MALVYGSEPSTAYSFFAIQNCATTVTKTMASATKHNSKPSSPSTCSGLASSPPIPIPASRAQATSSILTPDNSYETESNIPPSIRGLKGHTFQGVLPPTPSDAMPEKAQRSSSHKPLSGPSQAIIDYLLDLRGLITSPLEHLNENDLLQLRFWRDTSFALPFKVDRKSFLEWESNLEGIAGYEYDATSQELIIKAPAKPIHEETVTVFGDWFRDLGRNGDPDQGHKLKVNANLGYDLCGEYIGDNSTPDLAISVDNGDPSIVIEVGVSQDSESLKRTVRRWFIGLEVKLVILVDIEIHIADIPLYSSFSTIGTSSNLPYDLNTDDFTQASAHARKDIKALGLKILKWYERQDPAIPLVKMNGAKLYLYRQHTHPDTEVVLYKNGEYMVHDIQLLPQDFGLPDDSTYNGNPLPLRKLIDDFPQIIEDHSRVISEGRAGDLVIEQNLGTRNDGTYEDTSPSVPTRAVFSTVSPKPPRRSSSRVKRTIAEPKAPDKSQKKRKRDATQIEDTGQSFETNSSGVMFHCDLSEGEADQAFSNPTSFLGEASAVAQATTGPRLSSERVQKRRSTRGEKK